MRPFGFLLATEPPPRRTGVLVAVAAVALCTLLIYPLKQIAAVVSLGVVYLLAVLIARARGVRGVPTWSCGSPATARAQYTATAFSKPLRRIFRCVLFPERQRVVDIGISRWFPLRIRYAVTTRDTLDESARNVAAFVQRLARRTRIVQAGRLRSYVAYAVVAMLVLLVIAR